MKVLYQNRPADLWLGGDQIQLEKTMHAVAKLGHTVEFSGLALYKPALALRLFDVVHNFNFSMAWSKYQIWAAKNAGRKVVSSMIYHESGAFVSYADQQIMFDSLDAAIFLTKGEMERAKRHLTIDESKCHFIPNGIDSWWFEDKKVVSPDIPPFVLTVGRIEPAKGQLDVAKAVKRLGMTYVCIGSAQDRHYQELVQAEGAVVMAAMEHKDLLKFYKSCKVFALASRAEVMPLTVMEAGSQGANIVLTDHCEWEVPNAEYVPFQDVDAIEAAIKKSLDKPYNQELVDLLKQNTWEDVAKKIIKIYESITA